MAEENNATQDPMRKAVAGFLTAYLVLATVTAGYSIYTLWSVQTPVLSGQIPVPDCAKATNPSLTGLYPNRVTMGSSGSVLMVGCGMNANTQVKFNRTPHASLYLDSSHVRVDLTATDVAGTGSLIVTVSNGGPDFGTGALEVVPQTLFWDFLGAGPWPITPEAELLLVVLFSGAFGSCVYSLKSLADYRGGNRLYGSWFTFYIIQPFEGAGIAFIFYLVIRGGFLGGTSFDVKTGNQFGICAVAALVGVFSDLAFLKLRDIFIGLFKPEDDRGGKISPPKIATATLPDGVIGEPYSVTLRAEGGVGVRKWSVVPVLPQPLKLDADTGVISGTPAAALTKTKFRFTVTDSAKPPGSSTAELELEIKAPQAKGVGAGQSGTSTP